MARNTGGSKDHTSSPDLRSENCVSGSGCSCLLLVHVLWGRPRIKNELNKFADHDFRTTVGTLGSGGRNRDKAGLIRESLDFEVITRE